MTWGTFLGLDYLRYSRFPGIRGGFRGISTLANVSIGQQTRVSPVWCVPHELIDQFAYFLVPEGATMSAADVLQNLEKLKRRAQESGWEVREEWLNGKGCMVCELRGRKVLFIDISVDPREQWAQLRKISFLEERAASEGAGAPRACA